MRRALALAVVVAVGALISVVAAQGASNKVVASATGSGHFTSAGENRTFAFTARRYSDGSMTGEAQVNNRSQDRFAHIGLDCLAVAGSTAYASGVVDTSNDPTWVGAYGAFAVRDNGEGAKAAAPDQVTLFYYVLPPGACADPFWQAYLSGLFSNVEQGNVQVR